MKVIYKIFIILFATIFIIGINTNNVTAAEGLSGFFSGADSFIEEGKTPAKGEDKTALTIDETKIQEVSSSTYNILLGIGVAIAVIIGSILGIKFMIGSTEDKAQIKESLIPFIIGCIVVFGAFAIWKVVITIGNNF